MYVLSQLLFIQGGPKSKPLPVVLNRIKACQLDQIYSSN